MIPMVAVRVDKMLGNGIPEAMCAQATLGGKTIRLCRFVFAGEILVAAPEKTPQCPQCHFRGPEGHFGVSVRNAMVEESGGKLSVNDVGFRCPKCGKEFGFELLKDP
jgi:predicted RNA-binding Zn-ribbon protein involved in translation (DUF1610 family)